jgi:hypothetical protein
MAETDGKRCSKCGKTGRLDGFPPNSKMRDGRSSWCRGCHNAAVREWRERNPANAASYYTPVVHEPRPCAECGELFVPERSDTLVCKDLCRWRRSRRQRNEAAA